MYAAKEGHSPAVSLLLKCHCDRVSNVNFNHVRCEVSGLLCDDCRRETGQPLRWNWLAKPGTLTLSLPL
jgi:hypothetical protein